jgi:hypothetical protein
MLLPPQLAGKILQVAHPEEALEQNKVCNFEYFGYAYFLAPPLRGYRADGAVKK